MRRLLLVSICALACFESKLVLASSAPGSVAADAGSQTASAFDSGAEAPSPEAQQAARLEAERQAAEGRRLDQIFEEEEGRQGGASPGSEEEPSLSAAFVRMIVVLGLVCLLAYFILGKLLPRLLKVPMPRAPQRLMELVDRLAIDPKKSIVIVKLSDEYFMVGISDQSINLISRLDGDEIELAMASAATKTPRAGGLSNLLPGRMGGKET